jgi:L-rhamnose mutarotase
MEVDDFAQFLATMNASEANTRWQQMMSAYMTSDIDPATKFPFVLEEIFHLD